MCHDVAHPTPCTVAIVRVRPRPLGPYQHRLACHWMGFAYMIRVPGCRFEEGEMSCDKKRLSHLTVLFVNIMWQYEQTSTSLHSIFYLEAAGQYDLCSVSVDLSPTSENISVAGLVPWHYHRSPLNYSPNIKWILKWFYYLDHSKMYDWLIDWRRYRKSCWLFALIRASVRIDVKKRSNKN